jgi:hypothetical protein
MGWLVCSKPHIVDRLLAAAEPLASSALSCGELRKKADCESLLLSSCRLPRTSLVVISSRPNTSGAVSRNATIVNATAAITELMTALLLLIGELLLGDVLLIENSAGSDDESCSAFLFFYRKARGKMVRPEGKMVSERRG